MSDTAVLIERAARRHVRRAARFWLKDVYEGHALAPDEP